MSSIDQVLAFICGICSKDYDLTHIYVDAICKVANNYDPEGLGAFLLKLDAFLKDTPVTATILYSGEIDSLPEEARKFA